MKKVKLIALGLFLLGASYNASAQWTTSGTNIYNSNTGNVGIGTTAPGKKLHVKSSSTNDGITIENTNTGGSVLYLQNSSTNGKNWALFSSGSANTNIGGAGNFCLYDMSGGYNRFFVQGSSGNVGIGTSTPDSRLVVKGSGNTISSSALSIENSTGTDLLTVYNNGSVVIGDNTTLLPGATNGTNVVADYGLLVSKGEGILATGVKVALKNSTYWYDDMSKLERNLTQKVAFFESNNHLASIPSAEELVKGGIDVTTILAQMTKEHEETLLFLKDLKQEIDVLKAENAALKIKLESTK